MMRVRDPKSAQTGERVRRLTLRVFSLAALLTFVLHGSPEPKRVFSLCQLFQDLDAHDGRRVSVRGIYRFGREVAGLFVGSCEQRVMLDGHEVVPHIVLDFSTKTDALDQAVADAKMKPNAITLAVTGTLRTQSGAPYIGKDSKQYKARMFGHLGAFPAKLLVETIDQIEVSINSETPSNFALQKPKE